MFSFPQLTILAAIAVVAVEGKLQGWHRKCAFMQSMQEPLSLLVAEHFDEVLKNNYLRYREYPNELLYIWVTGIAFRKNEETQGVAILQVVVPWSGKPKVVHFCVFLENCTKGKDNGKTTFTFNLAKSKKLEIKSSEKEAELFAENFEKTQKNPTGPIGLVKFLYDAHSAAISQYEGFRGDMNYIKLFLNLKTGKHEVFYRPDNPNATWTIKGGVINP